MESKGLLLLVLLHSSQKELTSQTQRRRTLENNLETKQKHLETSQQAAPNIDERTEKIKEQIININRQRAQLAVEYKESVQVSNTTGFCSWKTYFNTIHSPFCKLS